MWLDFATAFFNQYFLVSNNTISHSWNGHASIPAIIYRRVISNDKKAKYFLKFFWNFSIFPIFCRNLNDICTEIIDKLTSESSKSVAFAKQSTYIDRAYNIKYIAWKLKGVKVETIFDTWIDSWYSLSLIRRWLVCSVYCTYLAEKERDQIWWFTQDLIFKNVYNYIITRWLTLRESSSTFPNRVPANRLKPMKLRKPLFGSVQGRV